MSRVYSKEFNNRTIIHENLASATMPEIRKTFATSEEMIQNKNNVLLIIDITGAMFSPAFSEAFEQHTKNISPYCGKKAIVGIFGIMNILRQALPFIESEFTFYEDMEEAQKALSR